MGLFDKLFGNKNRADPNATDYFKALTAYTPVFTTPPESVYEMELIRAVIHSFASYCSKLKPEVYGSAYKHLEKTLQYAPNPYMNTSQFLYRVATILSVNNNAFIVPIEDEYGSITGYYPILPNNAEVVKKGDVAYLRYTFDSGDVAAIEYSKVGKLTQFQFKSDFFGSSNSTLKPTMDLIHIQNQGIVNAVKNSANIRFLAKIANKLDPDKVKKERDRFAAENFTSENKSGLIVHDAAFTDLQQIDSKPYTVNANQMKLINENVFNYFGINENILQNKYTEEEFNAFYEGKIEIFAIQLSLAITNMTYSKREISHDNKIVFTTNRLQHISNKTKMEFSTLLIDRGIISANNARELWGLPKIEGGDKIVIRRDYVEKDMMHLRDKEIEKNLDKEVTISEVDEEVNKITGGEEIGNSKG